jgi:hypothetical protein
MKSLSSLFSDELDDDLKSLYASIGAGGDNEERLFRIQFLRVLNDLSDTILNDIKEKLEVTGH